jgi:hypothetical protein
MATVISEVKMERKAQIIQWGGAAHDDEHDNGDWLMYIAKQWEAANKLGSTPQQYRMRLIKIAALAIAAAESLDRKTARK